MSDRGPDWSRPEQWVLGGTVACVGLLSAALLGLRLLPALAGRLIHATLCLLCREAR